MNAHDAGMDVDTYFSPPDPSGEVPLPNIPNDPPPRIARARTGVLAAGVLIAIAGVFVLGRWTTGGERDALAGERDAARQERSALDDRVNELERDVSNISATNIEYESAIADVEQKAAADLAELNRLRTEAAIAAERNAELEDSNREQWEHVAVVSACGAAVSTADTAVETWNSMLPVMDDYLQSAVGSEEERVAGEKLDQAFLDIDDAETAYTGASTRCTSALEGLPDCDGERATMEVASRNSTPRTTVSPRASRSWSSRASSRSCPTSST
jgi:hypothetical protein